MKIGQKRCMFTRNEEKKNQFPQRKNIKIMYSVTKIYLALHENLFLVSVKVSLFYSSHDEKQLRESGTHKHMIDIQT